MITTEIPEAFSLTGKISIDLDNFAPRYAVAAGRVVEVIVPSGGLVKRGTAILSVTGDSYLDPQKALIRALAGKFDSRMSIEEAGALVEQLYQDLHSLKFTRAQIDLIRDGQTVIDPVPIFTPQGASLSHTLVRGQVFGPDDVLFQLAADRVISLMMSREQASFLRPGKTVTVRINDENEIEGHLKRVNDTQSPTVKEVLIDFPPGSTSVGEEVSVTFRFASWERIGPHFTSRDWPYDRLPRSEAELHSISRNRRVAPAVPPNQPSPSAKADIVKPKAPANPFGQRQTRRARPIRPSPRPYNPDLLGAPKSERYSLPLKTTEFMSWGISTIRASKQTITPQWICPAQVFEHEVAGAEIAISTSAAGTYHPKGHKRDGIVRAGTLIGFVQSDETHAINESRALVPVYADRDGVILVTFDSQRPVLPGDTVMKLRCTNMYFLRAKLPLSEYARLPRTIEAQIHWPSRGGGEPIFVNKSALIVERARTDVSVEFEVTFPAEIDQLQTGYARDLHLRDNSAARVGLAIPNDCVAQIEHSTEVLIHSEIGKLTPAAVECGAKYDGLVEITGGLSDGHFVVRDLAMLADEQPDIRAIMSGFWNPRP